MKTFMNRIMESAMLRKKALKNKKGFTLVELIVVIAILGVLAVIMVPAFTGYVQKANNSSDHSNVKSFCTAYNAAYAEASGLSSDSVGEILGTLGYSGYGDTGPYTLTKGEYTATGAESKCTITGPGLTATE